MINISYETIQLLNEALEAILLNRPYVPLEVDDTTKDLSNVLSQVNQLAECVRQVNTYIIDLSNGMLDIEMPPRSNYLAAGLKQLHSNLNHLTWQTQQIAQGDYKHKVDFMGDFAEAFNSMTAQLQEREMILRTQNEIIGTIFDHIECLFILSADNRQKAFYINGTARKVFNISRISDFSACVENSEFLSQLINLNMDTDMHRELFNPDTNKWYGIISSNLQWIEDKPAVLFYCTDITHHKKREETLERDAHIDPLTGVYNRRAFDVCIRRDFQHAKRLYMSIALLIIDIDFFKAYNDTYGHVQGDICLISVAKCIRSSVRRSTDFVARFGGEEFVVLLPNTDYESAMKVAEKIRSAVQNLEILNQSNHSEITKTTVSIGVSAILPTPGTTPMHLLHMADTALYRSKNAGRNCVTLAGE